MSNLYNGKDTGIRVADRLALQDSRAGARWLKGDQMIRLTAILAAGFVAACAQTVEYQYVGGGTPNILSDALIEETRKGFATYGLQDDPAKTRRKRA